MRGVRPSGGKTAFSGLMTKERSALRTLCQAGAEDPPLSGVEGPTRPLDRPPAGLFLTPPVEGFARNSLCRLNFMPAAVSSRDTAPSSQKCIQPPDRDPAPYAGSQLRPLMSPARIRHPLQPGHFIHTDAAKLFSLSPKQRIPVIPADARTYKYSSRVSIRRRFTIVNMGARVAERVRGLLQICD